MRSILVIRVQLRGRPKYSGKDQKEDTYHRCDGKVARKVFRDPYFARGDERPYQGEDQDNHDLGYSCAA